MNDNTINNEHYNKNDYELFNEYSNILIEISNYLNTIEKDFKQIDKANIFFKNKIIDLHNNLKSYGVKIKLENIEFRLCYFKCNKNSIFYKFINSEIKNLYVTYEKLEKLLENKINNENYDKYKKYAIYTVIGVFGGYILLQKIGNNISKSINNHLQNNIYKCLNQNFHYMMLDYFKSINGKNIISDYLDSNLSNRIDNYLKTDNGKENIFNIIRSFRYIYNIK